MNFLRMLLKFVVAAVRRLGEILTDGFWNHAPSHIDDDPQNPVANLISPETAMLRQARDIPGHRLTGPAYLANQLLCYALSAEERRPFMQMKGVSPALIGWLQSLDERNLDRLSLSSHEAIWNHVEGVKSIPGLTSFVDRPENYWIRQQLKYKYVVEEEIEGNSSPQPVPPEAISADQAAVPA